MKQITAAIIDAHTHVLPGVDDGARTLEESCQLLEQAFSQGVRAVIATPHYSKRRGTEGLKELAALLQEKIRQTLPDFCIYLGQETYYNEELVEHLKTGRALTMAGSRYVLVEFDPMVPYQTMFRGMRKLLMAGYIPVLAHMERYQCLRRENNLEDLAGSGCMFQMNYESLAGNLLQREVGWCRRQVKLGRIQLLGTDMHRLDYRPPEIRGAWRWLETHIDREQLDRMTFGSPMQMVRDEKIG